MLPLVAQHPQLLVIRSLTKLFAIAGLRLGYAIGAPARLARWAAWRDPWPVNGLAAAVAAPLLQDRRWQGRVQRWVAREGPWFFSELQGLGGITPFPSAANYLLVRGKHSLLALQGQLEQRRILVRDCRSFVGLDGHWLRLALLDRGRNQSLLAALPGALALTSSDR